MTPSRWSWRQGPAGGRPTEVHETMTDSTHDDRQVSNETTDQFELGIEWVSGFAAGAGLVLLIVAGAIHLNTMAGDPSGAAAGGALSLLFASVYAYLGYRDHRTGGSSDLVTDGGGPPLQDYPHDAAHELESRAQDRFVEKVEEYGPGRNWRDCADGEMAKAGIRKILDAHDLIHQGEPDEALQALADAENYIAFEADNIRAFIAGEDLATDGGRTIETDLQVLQRHHVTEHSHYTVHEVANVDGETDEEAFPSAVSKSLADKVWAEFGIDVEDHGIAVHDEGSHA